MADIKPIKPIKLCVNITIPTIDDDSISLYECVGILGNKLQEAIQKINESLGSLEGAYTADNPPPYPVTSVNGKTGAVVIDIPANVYTEDNPPPYPVTSVNRAETKDVITVFEPEGGSIEDVSQAELIAACKAGARLGAFNQDDGTCRLYHFNLYIDPERVDYNEVAGGGTSGVISVNDQTGAVNIFNAPISAATAESVTALNTSTNTKINQLKADKLDKTATAADSSKLGGKGPEYYASETSKVNQAGWAPNKYLGTNASGEVVEKNTPDSPTHKSFRITDLTTLTVEGAVRRAEQEMDFTKPYLSYSGVVRSSDWSSIYGVMFVATNNNSNAYIMGIVTTATNLYIFNKWYGSDNSVNITTIN